MPSLKKKLLETLQQNRRLSLTELENLCKAYPAKQSTAEKRLREFREPLHADYHPEVGVEMKDGYINAYVWKERDYKIVQTAPITPAARAFLQRWKVGEKKELTNQGLW